VLTGRMNCRKNSETPLQSVHFRTSISKTLAIKEAHA
jgi:hypothetical protein